MSRACSSLGRNWLWDAGPAGPGRGLSRCLRWRPWPGWGTLHVSCGAGRGQQESGLGDVEAVQCLGHPGTCEGSPGTLLPPSLSWVLSRVAQLSSCMWLRMKEGRACREQPQGCDFHRGRPTAGGRVATLLMVGGGGP